MRILIDCDIDEFIELNRLVNFNRFYLSADVKEFESSRNSLYLFRKSILLSKLRNTWMKTSLIASMFTTGKYRISSTALIRTLSRMEVEGLVECDYVLGGTEGTFKQWRLNQKEVTPGDF